MVITLPRQARDKHSESTPKKAKKSPKKPQKSKNKSQKKPKKAKKSTPKNERAVFFASSLLDAYDMADAAT